MLVVHANSAHMTLAALVERYVVGVFRYLRSLLGDTELARELTQETFLKLHAHAATATPALVFTAARSCAVDAMRRQRVRRRHEATVDESLISAAPASLHRQPDREVETLELRKDLLAALAALPEPQRSVFQLSEIEGLTYDEIAAVLHVSPGTIASRKYHAVRTLREHLRRLGHGA